MRIFRSADYLDGGKSGNKSSCLKSQSGEGRLKTEAIREEVELVSPVLKEEEEVLSAQRKPAAEFVRTERDGVDELVVFVVGVIVIEFVVEFAVKFVVEFVVEFAVFSGNALRLLFSSLAGETEAFLACWPSSTRFVVEPLLVNLRRLFPARVVEEEVFFGSTMAVVATGFKSTLVKAEFVWWGWLSDA